MGSLFSCIRARHRPVLPPEITRRIASFLLGVEVVSYARASPTFYQSLNHSLVWVRRVEPAILQNPNLFKPRIVHRHEPRVKIPPQCCFEKAVYVRQRAFLFRGHATATWCDRLREYRPHPRGDFVSMLYTLLYRMGTEYSFEFTFSVLSMHGQSRGGILLGFQDTSCDQVVRLNLAPHEFFTVASVDASGSLYVGLDKDEPPTKAADLALDAWHHVVVTSNGQDLRAYVGGELRLSERMPRGFPRLLPHGQVGTGFGYDSSVAGDQGGAWHPFHGLMADARIWSLALDADTVRMLFHDHAIAHTPCFSLQNGRDGPPRVLTSRPIERYARILS